MWSSWSWIEQDLEKIATWIKWIDIRLEKRKSKPNLKKYPPKVLPIFICRKVWNQPIGLSLSEFCPNQSVITAFFRPLFQHSSSNDGISSQTSKLRICATAVLKCYELVSTSECLRIAHFWRIFEFRFFISQKLNLFGLE